MRFFEMIAQRHNSKYVSLTQDIEVLAKGCAYSEFQYLNHKPMECPVSEKGGADYPDFLQHGNIPLISTRFRKLLDDLHVDNLFYKPVMLIDDLLGERNQYYLALPPCINCLDVEESTLEGMDEKKGIPPDLVMVRALKPVIIPSALGNYQIFKIAGIVNSGIYVTEEVKEAVENKQLSNVFFQEMEE